MQIKAATKSNVGAVSLLFYSSKFVTVG